MKLNLPAPVQEKTTLQSIAMILIGFGTSSFAMQETTENKIFSLIFIIMGVLIMLHKYEREMKRGVSQ